MAEPVTDWKTDWDHHDPGWVQDPFPIWAELRRSCPVAHTDRYNEGAWLPTRHQDLIAVAKDTETFSNDHDGAAAGGTYERVRMPPIHLDPPEHGPFRRALLPFFNPKRVAAWEPLIEAHCNQLAEGLKGQPVIDVATEYAAHIPAEVIAIILGIPTSDGDKFRRWIHAIEVGDTQVAVREQAVAEMREYFAREVADRRQAPRDDLISYMVQLEVEGRPLTGSELERSLVLLLIAGIDTTWSVMGAALWHLANTPQDRQRLVAEVDLMPNAVEEFLRAFASVSLWRRVTQRGLIGDVEVNAGDTVMMTFPAACRDPELFDRPDEVLIDRQKNRHVAFGAGVHRCLGSNLARLELVVGIRTWLKHFPDFDLAPGAEVTWAEGQIRGPRSVPVVIE